MKRIVLVLGDQLTRTLSSLRAADRARDVVLMAEVMGEATYVRHHKKKIALVLAAMRHFAAELRADGWHVDYITLDDPANTGSLRGEVMRACARHATADVIVTEPGEWRLMQDIEKWPAATLLPDERFLADRHGFAVWAQGRLRPGGGGRMEHFYRLMRRKTGLLMEGEAPAGGQWNFDADNRAPPPGALGLPQPMQFASDAITGEVLDMVQRRFPDHFGDLSPFWFATDRAQAEAAFAHFLRHGLRDFGRYQDAMLIDHRFLCHSAVSAYLNLGLLDPLAMCQAAEAEWRAGRVPLNSAEGFIRQIIGWREFVRGIYWWRGPDYARSNALDAHRPLPGFYWSADTPMACLRACVMQTREEAYAHHIQRLMITGNFALLAGIDPHELHEWYLAVYADAFEWVELPNTIGMSQFADGGLLASKPYAASGAYIGRMSDYCGTCTYDVKVKEGANACPFNLLYWHFIARHAERLRRNPRMAQMVRTWEKFSPEKQEQLKQDAEAFLAGLA
ncbi:deoxyribodipyrimidine photolyase-related protein [Novosphingobium sp. SG751A]|uniref:cryptochrome/photolyase family protein n=1 Tax=Novosphingobium sp. SG751A TaxID=2587000 RepID=UPI0015527B4D|nr:cryptochrome/photolyase family protein [Novosphingobium sp. SG751A]NOW45201.1 deoxyribodipyrimidine photolyase-related protein [Novosphingobium sp. SG751A]